jgi:hypothetical protein
LSGQFDIRGAQNEKVAKVKEKVRRERLTRAFNDRAADLRDEMLLLDDVFQVRAALCLIWMRSMKRLTAVHEDAPRNHDPALHLPSS